MADLKTVIEFLNGERTLLGCEFGEKPFGERGQFWWRKHLTEAWRLHNNPTPVQAEQSLEVLGYLYSDGCGTHYTEDVREVLDWYGIESHTTLTDHAKATAALAQKGAEIALLVAERDLAWAMCDQLRDQLAEAKKDAERYRWLRDGNNDKEPVPTAAMNIAINRYGFEWDAAIDAALSSQLKKEQDE